MDEVLQVMAKKCEKQKSISSAILTKYMTSKNSLTRRDVIECYCEILWKKNCLELQASKPEQQCYHFLVIFCTMEQLDKYKLGWVNTVF